MAFVARLDAAEAAVRRQDYRAAVHLLHRAPSLLQGAGDGRVLELMALCASHSTLPSAGDPWPLWHRCLAAYQDGQDARGMERAHRAVGLWAYGRGELAVASQELRRAQRLLERQHRPEACIAGLCIQAEVAMAQGRDAIHDAYGWADEAVIQSQQQPGWGLLESRARLMRARASCLMGGVAEAALDMLWAERVAAPLMPHHGAEFHHDVLQVVMCRAESLLLLGHPRRAATCLATLEGAVRRTPHQDLVAHYQLLVCEAYLSDQPHAAHDAGLRAQQYYGARKLNYFRAACDIALARSAQRLSLKDTAERMRALASAKLERWPLLAFGYRRAQQDVDAPHHHALGAVKTPWMRAVGKIDLSPPKALSPEAVGQRDEAQGFMARLTHAIAHQADDTDQHKEAKQHGRN